MSNTIKLKRGSGSDPSASDLSIGEIAIRTDSGKLFTKKDNGSVAEISGSGGIDDGDKGDITVSNGGDTFTIDSGVVTSAKIADGTIVNADINASAAIAGSKINPNFGSQDITTTGELQCKDMSLIDTTPKLTFFDSDNNPDFTLSANSGSFRITDSTNSAERLVVNSDGHVDVLGNLDVGSGLDVTGHATVSQSLTVTGTTSLGETVNITGNDPNITFVDSNNNPDFKIFANAGTFLIHDYTNSNDILKVQTDGHLDITPHTDFAAGIDVTGNITVTGTVDGRDVATDGSKLDGIESGATADQSASEILTLIKTVDGAGSGLDADTLDGISSASFVRSDAADTISGDITFTDSGQYPVVIGSASGMDDGRLLLRGSSNPYIRFREGNTDKAFIQWNSSGYLRLMNQEDSSVLRIKDDIEFSPDNSTYYKMWNAYNDGSGSGLDADLLDGVQGSSFVRSDANDAISGFLTITNDSGIKIYSSTNGVGSKIQFSDHAGGSYAQNGTLTYKHADGAVTTTGGNSNDGWLFEGSETRTVVKVVGDIEATSNIYGAGSNITALNASNISSGTLAAARVATLNQNTTGSSASCTGNSATATQLQNARTIAGTSFNGTANISINYNNLTNKPTIPTNNNQLTNGAGYITSASFSDVAGGGTFTGDISLSGGVGAMTVNGNSDIRFSNGTWSGNSTKIQHHSNYLYIQGGSNGIIFRSSGGTDRAFFNSDGDFIPSANNQYTLGNGSNRWQDVFTNDLHLSNEGGSNKVDNTWGDYTIQEGVDDLFIINNRNGKMFKFMLQEVK